MVASRDASQGWEDAVEAELEDVSGKDRELINAIVWNVFSRWMLEAIASGEESEREFKRICRKRRKSALGAIVAIVEVTQVIGRGEDPMAALRERVQ